MAAIAMTLFGGIQGSGTGKAAHGANTPAAALQMIRTTMQQGDLAGAFKLAQAAHRDHPNDPQLAHMAGDLALKSGDAETAATLFGKASQMQPALLDYALDQAIALQRLERHRAVIALLVTHEEAGKTIARYASIRALSHRTLGELDAAATWYDAVLALQPSHIRGLHGRARVALERAEPDALARFDRALQANPGDADLWLGKAQALDVTGDTMGSRTVIEQVCEQAPSFIAALEFASGLRLNAGEKDFTAPFTQAAMRAPQDPNIPSNQIETLAGLDFAQEAADVAAAARRRFPQEPHFALLEAAHASTSGQWNRAEGIFEQLDYHNSIRALQEARHRIRRGDLARADALLERALADDPWMISAWALRGLAWRMRDDDESAERAAWLHEQAGLVQFRPLEGRPGLIDDAADLLRGLHEGSAMPLGQSLRGGTQTRGILFHRTEPLLVELHSAILKTVVAYQSELAPHDATHPLLRHRDRELRLAGSWSVRLTGQRSSHSEGGDYHRAHIHPMGLISSALYLCVPEAAKDEKHRRGWLEIGRPAPDLKLDLEPLRVIQPREGHLALFPSTLYHGTRPFGGIDKNGERMTVAFDVVADAD